MNLHKETRRTDTHFAASLSCHGIFRTAHPPSAHLPPIRHPPIDAIIDPSYITITHNYVTDIHKNGQGPLPVSR